MRITEKQLLQLYQIAVDSLNVNIVGNPYFKYSDEDRVRLVDAIASQQSEEIVEVEPNK